MDMNDMLVEMAKVVPYPMLSHNGRGWYLDSDALDDCILERTPLEAVTKAYIAMKSRVEKSSDENTQGREK